ncbi:chemosensory pili system protein ChpA (sensor histidine kinase/response regulator) [Gammaproteobacteria bacterium]
MLHGQGNDHDRKTDYDLSQKSISPQTEIESGLGWIKVEIDHALELAQTALDAYAENTEDADSLRECKDRLHEVSGSLQMVEVRGGVFFAQEAEQLVQALVEGRASENALDVLMSALLQLPDYLERLQTGQRDLPIALLPIINGLRTARNAPPLKEETLFFPDLFAIPLLPTVSIDKSESLGVIRRARTLFQSGLAAWHRNSEDKEALARLAQSVEQLRSVAFQPEVARLWWVSAGFIEATKAGAIPTADARPLLGKLERQIKRWIENNGEKLVSEELENLIRLCLYHIAIASPPFGALVEELRTTFRLAETLPSKADIIAIQQGLRGANRAVIATVSAAIREDLSVVMEALEQAVRKRSLDPGELLPTVNRMRQIAGTLEVVEQQDASKDITEIAEILSQRISNHVSEPPLGQVLQSFAERLVRLEATLVGLGAVQLESIEGVQTGFAVDEWNLDHAVLKQAHTSLFHAKESIVTESKDKKTNWFAAQDLLKEVAGGLSMINLERPARLATACVEIIQSIFQSSDQKKDIEQLKEELAEVVAALELYLEEQLRSLSGESFLKRGEETLAKLALVAELAAIPAWMEALDSVPVEEAQEIVFPSMETSPLPETQEITLSTNTEDLLQDWEEMTSGQVALLEAEEVIDLTIMASNLPPISSPESHAVTPKIFEFETNPPSETQETNLGSSTEDLLQDWEEMVSGQIDLPEAEEVIDLTIMASSLPPVPTPEPPAQTIVTPTLFGSEAAQNPEIVEIFYEEVEEVLETIDQQILHFRKELSSGEKTPYAGEDPLEVLRRSFHTLKGSSRTMGMTRLGELAWAVENLLNRVLKQVFSFSSEILEVASEARFAVPALVEDFKNRRNTARGAEEISEHAWRLAHGPVPKAENVPTPTPLPVPTAVEEKNTPLPAVPTPVLAPAIVIEPRLLEVFTDETHGHLTTIENALARCRENKVCGVSDSLVRAFHTIQGSARMAQIEEIGLLGKALEKHVKARAAASLDLDDASLSVIQESVQIISEWLETLAVGQFGPDVSPCLARIEAMWDTSFPVSSSSTSSEIREEVLQIFLEEAVEAIQSIEVQLTQWRLQPKESPDSLFLSLESLRSSAELAQFPAIQEVCQTFRYFIEQVTVNDHLQNESSNQLCAETIEHLWVLLESIRERLIPPTPEDLCSALKELARTPIPLPPIEVVSPAPTVLPVIKERKLDNLTLAFLEESEDLLASLDNVLQELSADSSNAPQMAELKRVLHTLKGGAKMIDVQPMAKLAHDLESIIARVVNGLLPPTLELFDLIQVAADQFSEMLDQIREGIPVEIPMALEQKILDFLDSALTERTYTSTSLLLSTETTPLASSSAPEIGERKLDNLTLAFLEESEDLLASLDNVLQELSADSSNAPQMAELKRVLHTLKGGAKMIDVQPMAKLAHDLESMIARVEKGNLSPTPELFDLIQVTTDQFSEILNQIRKGIPVEVPKFLEQKIKDISKGKISGVETFPSTEPEAIPSLQTAKPTVSRDADSDVRSAQEQIRVSAALLNKLVGHAAEVSITRSRIWQQINGLRYYLHEMDGTVRRLHEQSQKLGVKTISYPQERNIATTGQESSNPVSLNLESSKSTRHPSFVQLLKAFEERVADLNNEHGSLSLLTRDAEMLLTQQSRIVKELHEGLIRTRMVPFSEMTRHLRQIVRQTARSVNVKATLQLVGAEIEIDRAMRDSILESLGHLLRNALSHGIEPPEKRKIAGKRETGTITVSLRREGQEIVLLVQDDGRGLNIEAIREKAEKSGRLDKGADISDRGIMQFILEPDFSTAKQITETAGRGVGMDVVANGVKDLGGTLEIDSESGCGASFTIRLPMTLAVSKVLLVQVQNDLFAIPIAGIHAVLQVDGEKADCLYTSPQPTLTHKNEVYQFVHAAALLNAALPRRSTQVKKWTVLLFKIEDSRVALAIDGMKGSREIVVKSVGPQLAKIREIAGATILGDGQVVLVLDVPALFRKGLALHGALVKRDIKVVEETLQASVLVVDDSIAIRTIMVRLLERNRMTTFSARDGVDAVALLQKHVPDIILMDVDMPRMDGYQLAAYVREQPSLKDIPIIMITSRDEREDRERAMRLRINNYMVKPYQESELIDAIRYLLPQQQNSTGKSNDLADLSHGEMCDQHH